MLKNLKVKQKTTLEHNVSFDFPVRILLGPVGREKAVGFFRLAHNGVSVSQACGGGNEINLSLNKYLIEQRFFLIPSYVSLGYALVISCFLIFEEFL